MDRHAWGWAALTVVFAHACAAGGDGGTGAPSSGGDDAAVASDPVTGDGEPGDGDAPPVDTPPAEVPVDRPPAEPPPDFVSTLPPLTPGEPIVAAPNEWTWVDVPEAVCQRNDPTGMHFNMGDPDKLVILMEGGGACYNAFSCALSLAIHPLGASKLDTPLITEVYGNNIFDRNDPDNPLRTWSYVFFPYCSGDVFAGASRIEEGFGGRSQQGYYNVQAYLKRLIATFPNAKKVLLTGVSAGGFGAGFNYDQVAEAFGPKTRVYLVDDSGPPMPTEQMTPCLQERWREAWSLDDIMPPPEACPGCRDPYNDVGVMGIVEYLAKKYKNRRFAVVSGAHDAVIREFFGFGLNDCAGLDPPLDLPVPSALVPEDVYEAGLHSLLDYTRGIEGGAVMKGFIVPDALMHTWLVVPGNLTGVVVDDVSLGEWLRRLVEDDPAWDHAGVH